MFGQTQKSHPRRSIVRCGLQRPKWICSQAGQVVIMIRDASISMEGDKAKAAEAASQDLCAELGHPANKGGFWVSFVDFAGDAKCVQPLKNAEKLKGHRIALKAGKMGYGTSLGSGMEEALSILKNAARRMPEERQFLRPVCLMFSDGEDNTEPEPEPLAKRIKAEADLVTVAFGDDADEALLKKLATSPQHFYRCKNGRELRAFLASAGKTMTGTMARRTNATQALTQIQ